jgi:hypothetical protein
LYRRASARRDVHEYDHLTVERLRLWRVCDGTDWALCTPEEVEQRMSERQVQEFFEYQDLRSQEIEEEMDD